MIHEENQAGHARERREFHYPADAFLRRDESEDSDFYAVDRMVDHLDSTARETVQRIIESLVVEKHPHILDLMASWDSHLPAGLQPGQVEGLGMNAREMKANPVLNRHLVHDLNQDPRLPLEPESFDLVLNVVSVDYLTQPEEVFRQVGRVLRPGGLFLVIFSDRWFEPKVTNLWRNSSEIERIILVEHWFRQSGCFGEPKLFVSKGRPRPADDKYAHLGIPSDPVIAIYADKLGGDPQRAPRPQPRLPVHKPDPAELQRRCRAVKDTLACPYCGARLRKWEVPQTPFTEWDNEYMYICFNDACPYLVGGWESMGRQGNLGSSYRLMYNPVMDSCLPVPVTSLGALKSGILD